MVIIEATKDDFESVVTSHDMVLVDFWAPWCAPCRAFAPIYESVAAKHPDVAFVKVNTEEEQELAGVFQIRSIPTLMIFREQVIVFAQPGMLPAQALEDLIGQARALDMAKVHQELAEQHAQSDQG